MASRQSPEPPGRLLDLDLQTGDCALSSTSSRRPGLREALANPLRIDNVFLERTDGDPWRAALCARAPRSRCTPTLEFTAEAVETLVRVLRTQFHYIIVDVPRIPAPPYRRALDIADLRVIVADQTLRSVRDTVRLRDALGEGDAEHRNLPRRQPQRRGRSPRHDPERHGRCQAAAERS